MTRKEFSLNQNIIVTGTRPISFSLNDEEFEVFEKTWKNLYCILIGNLFKDEKFSLVVKECISWSIQENFLRSPRKVKQIYIETNYSAIEFIRIIRDVLEVCEIPLENMSICYIEKGLNEYFPEFECSFVENDILQKENCLETSNFTIIQTLDQIQNVTGTRPQNVLLTLGCKIFPIAVKSWTSLYVEILEKIITKKMGSKNLLLRSSLVRFGNEYMRRPRMLVDCASNLYVELNVSANQILRNIQKAFEVCAIAFQNLKIEYLIVNKEMYEKPQTIKPCEFVDFHCQVNPDWSERTKEFDLTVCSRKISHQRKLYRFANNTYWGMTSVVWAVVNRYVKQHPEISFDKLQKVFPDDAARPGFAKMLRRNEDVEDYCWKGRRFNKDLISLGDGTQVAVSTQWTPANFSSFCKLAQKAGLFIEDVDAGTDNVPPARKKNDSSNNALLAPYKKVLVEKFSNGYSLNSIIQRDQFRHFYGKLNGSVISASDKELDNTIEKCGMLLDGRLYVTECVLDDSKKTEILDYIGNQLNEHPRLYLEKLFDYFADDFRDTPIENVDVLKTYLLELTEFQCYINKDCIFRDAGYRHVGSPKDEVKRLLEEERRPMSDDEIFKKLDWIPEEKIKVAFICSNTQEILSNGDHSRFILETFDISGDELEWLSNWVRQELDAADFMCSMDLVKALKSKYPDFAERNCNFRDIGIRNALALLLQDDFNFKGNLIAKKGKAVSNEKLFVDFCKTRESFNVDDVDAFADSLNVPALYDVIYTYSFRLNDRDFIRDIPSMDIDAIDSAIENFMNERNFIPLKMIDFWGNFPITVSRWNHFLLESFLWRCSKKFKLVHSNFSKTTFAGAIVRKDVTLNFEDVLVYALSAKDFDAVNAKKFLKDEGFLAREKCSNINTLLEKARQLRSSRK